MAGRDESMVFSTAVDLNGKPYHLTLTTHHLQWSSALPKRGYCQHYVSVSDILAVNAKQSTRTCNTNHPTNSVELVQRNGNEFSVHVIERNGRHKWRPKEFTFRCRQSDKCKDCVHKINEAIQIQDTYRPKRLLLFVNPVGGKKKGVQIYREKVAPLFELAGVTTEVVITTRVNHARDFILEKDLHKLDGIACVGGDGMASELINGLILRTQKDGGINPNDSKAELVPPHLKIGIIPAGSTDVIVYTSMGINDPVTATLSVIVGDTQPLDVCSVHQGEELINYTVSFIGYGFFGDVLKDSESYRWMGPARYDFSGVKKVLTNKSYDAEIAFLPNDDPDNGPTDHSQCRVGCRVCHRAGDRERQWQQQSADKTASVDCQTTEECSNGAQNWQCVRGKFINVSAAVFSCMCKKSPKGVSPSAHLADGCMDLIFVKHCHRYQFLRYLLRLSTSGDHFDLDFVEVHRVKEFKFKVPNTDRKSSTDESELEVDGNGGPLTPMAESKPQSRKFVRSQSNSSVWNADGEVIHQSDVDVKVHCQLINIFARGVDDNETRTCAACSKKWR
ncbi:ceramide kinase-like [Glandiceps talaboti]